MTGAVHSQPFHPHSDPDRLGQGPEEEKQDLHIRFAATTLLCWESLNTWSELNCGSSQRLQQHSERSNNTGVVLFWICRFEVISDTMASQPCQHSKYCTR